jgi:hypothetical protein
MCFLARLAGIVTLTAHWRWAVDSMAMEVRCLVSLESSHALVQQLSDSMTAFQVGRLKGHSCC